MSDAHAIDLSPESLLAEAERQAQLSDFGPDEFREGLRVLVETYERCGLTPKHVNVPELLRVLDFTPLAARALQPRRDGAEHIYDTDALEFRLSYFDVTSAPISVSVRGPEIWLATRGEVTLVEPGGHALTLDAGGSAFVPFAARELSLRGSGRIFRAAVPHSL